MAARLLRIARQPVDDFLAALTVWARGGGWPRLVLLIIVMALTWWIYVPVHELAHAYGCLMGGGTVSRLDIDPVYGAALLQRVFPFVNVGSEYAGQLTGFDTGGSDLTYLLTDFLPFLATILLGVPMLQAAGQSGRRPWVQTVLFGAALPIALAPFISLTGDYYEMGSIMVSRATAWLDPDFVVTRWRSDDLVKLGGRLFGPDGGGTFADGCGLALSFALGVVLAVATYGAGSAWAAALGVGRSRAQR